MAEKERKVEVLWSEKEEIVWGLVGDYEIEEPLMQNILLINQIFSIKKIKENILQDKSMNVYEILDAFEDRFS